MADAGPTVHVQKMTEAEGRRLYASLGGGAWAFRPVPYARWSAQGEGVTVTHYVSGKLVVQGGGTAEFLRVHLGREAASGPAPSSRPAEDVVEGPTAGSDESGKGDYFGPLCVAAALVRPSDVPLIRELGVCDSKLASEQRIRSAEGLLAQSLPNAVRTLMPEEYNARWAEVRNVNVLLGRLHAEVLEEVLAKERRPQDARIVVDKFGDESHVRKHLGPAGRQVRVFTMRTGAESHPSVAAASFLARAAFLRGFDEVRNLAGDEPLPRGASDPRIVPAARRLLREGGEAWLGRFAKLHFRVTEQARR